MTDDFPILLTPENTVECGLSVRVFLDGEEIKGVVAANVRDGWGEKVRHNGNGKIVIDGDSVAIDRVSGIVVAEIRSSK